MSLTRRLWIHLLQRLVVSWLPRSVCYQIVRLLHASYRRPCCGTRIKRSHQEGCSYAYRPPEKKQGKAS